jgi:hypothetical protein
MRRWLAHLVLAVALVLFACTPPALVLQREALRYFQKARGVEQQASGHARSHAALCREAAAAAEEAAHAGYPEASSEAKTRHREMLRDCQGVTLPMSVPTLDSAPAPPDGGTDDGGPPHVG